MHPSPAEFRTMAGLPGERRVRRGSVCSCLRLQLLSPQRFEKSFFNELLGQAVVVELRWLSLFCRGSFLANQIEGHLKSFPFDQRYLFDEIIGVLHGAVEHARIDDFGILAENFFEAFLVSVHEAEPVLLL